MATTRTLSSYTSRSLQTHSSISLRNLISLQHQTLQSTTSIPISHHHHHRSFRHHRRHASTQATQTHTQASQIIRPLVPPPDANSGPLMSRRPDRELPDIRNKRTWLKTLPIFIALITVSSLAIFNYQKSSSSTVNSILYALRTNPAVREVLGDEIYFAAKVPWIRGELNQLHGIINISFWVKGTKGTAQTKFMSVRKRRDGYFETTEWSLKTPDGRVIHLLDLEGAKDPMHHVVKE